MLKLSCINIEGDRHLDRVVPFLKQQKSDVVCLQEVVESTLSQLQSDLYSHCLYVPMVQLENTTKGVAILSMVQPTDSFYHYYAGTDTIPNAIGKPNNNKRALAGVKILFDNKEYTITTTHFTWSAKGRSTKKQHADLDGLFKHLDTIGKVVLCGDFNAPRGGEIYNRLIQRYVDNIPQEIISTVDPQLHKAGPLPFVVDYIFSTPHYLVTDVHLHQGVSDHQAVVATIDKTS